MKSVWAKTICHLFAVLLIWMPFQAAQAGMIGTDQVTTMTTAQSDRSAVLSFVSRADVANQLQGLGLDAANAKDRVAAMSNAEVSYLAGRINSLPAGGDTAGVLLIILVIAAIWWVWQR